MLADDATQYSVSINVTLVVAGSPLADHGDFDAPFARLRWLDAQAGVSEAPPMRFANLSVDVATGVVVAGFKTITLGAAGLPASITVATDEPSTPAVELLAGPVTLQIHPGPLQRLAGQPAEGPAPAPASPAPTSPVRWTLVTGWEARWAATSTSSDGLYRINVSGVVQSDGYMDFNLTVRPTADEPAGKPHTHTPVQGRPKAHVGTAPAPAPAVLELRLPFAAQPTPLDAMGLGQRAGTLSSLLGAGETLTWGWNQSAAARGLSEGDVDCSTKDRCRATCKGYAECSDGTYYCCACAACSGKSHARATLHEWC